MHFSLPRPALPFLGFLAMLFACGRNESPPHEKRPNIVWLVAEDQSPQFFSIYGDSTIRLPNIESLAEEGVVFTNAYSPVPVCAPARSAIITGMYPTTLGTHNMRTYAPWREMNEPSLGIPSYSPIVPDGVRMFTEYLRKEGYYCTNNAKEDYNFRKLTAAWDASHEHAHWRNRPEDTPFFSVFNFGICHESGIWRQTDSTLFVNPDSVPVPPYFPDNEVIRHDLAVNYSNLKRLDEQIGEVLRQLKEDGLYEDSFIFFYADHGGPFPRHKRALYETGIRVPMVLKFTGKERKNGKDDRFISFIDLAPTVLSLAGIKPPKVMQGKAQFGAYASEKQSDHTFHSSDRFDEVYDRLRAVRSGRYKYIRNFNPEISNALPVSYREQMPMMQELKKRYENGELDPVSSLWFQTPKPEEELYDLKKDPFELDNLAGREEHRDTLLHLRQLLNTWIKETNDLGRIPESELITGWLPNGNQPGLPDLVLTARGDIVTLSCPKSDATILWRPENDSIWKIYTEPLPADLPFVAKAERIGFEDSPILEYQ